MMASLAHLGPSAARTRVSTLLERFDLGAAANRSVSTYSGGMRRRLDLAISLISAPPVVFLDEPTTGLDPRSRSQLWTIVRELAADGTTIMLTTQYLEEADQLADRVAVLDAGRIVATGSPTELKTGLRGDRVELAFGSFAEFETARGVDFGAGAVFDDERLALSVPAGHPVAATRELLALADAAGLSVAGISILKPTLDDVFLNLTGTRPAESREDVAA
jgi:ABC-2 type transport system ATP-binding protein